MARGTLIICAVALCSALAQSAPVIKCPQGNASSFNLPVFFRSTYEQRQPAWAPCQFQDLTGDTLPDYICSDADAGDTGHGVINCTYINTGTGWVLHQDMVCSCCNREVCLLLLERLA